jgi:drug/metabolite transporter (DMT)-like permease
MRRPAVFVLVAATVVVLGANWPIMAVGLEHVTPLWLASFRIDAAALVVIVLLSARGRLRVPARGDRAIWLSVGLVQTGLVTALVFVALQVVPPGRSSIVAYTSALWAIPLAVRFLGERLTAARGAGVAIGTLGLVVLLQPWALDWGDARLLAGTAMLLVGAIATAATTVHVRGHRWVRSPMDLMPWQLGLAAIPLTALALVVEGLPDVRWTPATVAVVVYQAVPASAFAMWALLTIGRSLPAIGANLSVMAVPVVGLVASVVFLGERLTVSVVAGLVIVLAGVTIGLVSDRTADRVDPGR